MDQQKTACKRDVEDNMTLPSSYYHSSDRPQSLPYHTLQLYSNSQSPSDVIETDSKQALGSPSVLAEPQLSNQFIARSPFFAGEREERDMKKTPTTPVSLPGQSGSQGTVGIVSRGPHPLMGSYQSMASSSSGRSLRQPPSEMQIGQNVTPIMGPAQQLRTAKRLPHYPPQRRISAGSMRGYSSTSLSSGTYSSVSAESLTEPFPYQQLPPYGMGHTFRQYSDVPSPPPKRTPYQYSSSSPMLQPVSQYGTPLLHEQSSSSQPNSLTQDYLSTTPSGMERTTNEMNMLSISGMQRSNPIDVTVEPKDCEVFPNERAEFLCRARVMGSQEEPIFLWYKDEQPMVGEVNNEYIVDSATVEDTGTYFCLVTDSGNRYQRKSRNAKLSLIESCTGANFQGAQKRAPEITQQPGPYVEATAGEKLQLIVKVKGEDPLRYKWYKDTRELMYATTSILEIPNANQLDNGQYCCAVANDYGSVLGEIYQVKVIQRPRNKVSSQQREAHMSPSAATTVAQYMHQPRPTSFQKWDNQPVTDLFLQEVSQLVVKQTCNWSRLALFLGLTTNDVVQSRMHFHQPEEQAFQLLRMWRERKNGGDKSTLQTILSQAGINLNVLLHNSTAGRLAVKPRITLQPQSLNVVYGQPARIFVEVENTNHYTAYQWYRNNEILRGKVGPELIISSSVDSDRGDYFCVITNQTDYVKSQVARIDVVDIHPISVHYQTAQQSDMYRSDPWNPTYLGYHSRGTATEEELSPKGQCLPSTGVASTTTCLDDKFPRIIKHPESQMIEPGSALTLTCAGVGAGELGYLWYFNGLSLKDETGPEYSINCFTDEDEGMYACQVANTYGHAMSNMAHVVMKLN